MNVKALFLMLAVAAGHSAAASASNEAVDSADLTAAAFEDELAAVTEGNSCNRRVSAALR